MGNCRSHITPAALGSVDLRPIELGAGVRIETPVILAPMSGVTDRPFRRTAKQLGAGMVVSEMIASWAMIRENQKTLGMAEIDGCGGVSAVQLPAAIRSRWPGGASGGRPGRPPNRYQFWLSGQEGSGRPGGGVGP